MVSFKSQNNDIIIEYTRDIQNWNPQNVHCSADTQFLFYYVDISWI